MNIFLNPRAKAKWKTARVMNAGMEKLPFLDQSEILKSETNPPFPEDKAESFPAYPMTWNSPFHWTSGRPDFYSLKFGGSDYSRICTQITDTKVGGNYGCGVLKGRVREVVLIETDPTHGLRGAGSRLLELLIQTDPEATWIAYSDEDEFWSKTGWRKYDHPERGSRPLFVRNPALQNPECSFGLKPPDSSSDLAT